MRRSFLIGMMSLALIASITAAGASSGSLPGGSAISVSIDSPQQNGFVETTEFTLSGSVSVGMGTAVKDTSLVYILDISGSTANPAGVDCDDDEIGDTILFCEKEAVRRVNSQAAEEGSPVKNSGIGEFASSGNVVQSLIAPGDAISDALNDVGSPGGQTNFGAGLAAANDILSDPEVATEKIVVFLTDGAGSGTSELPANTTVAAFAIGGAGCSGALDAISDTCEVVDDLSVLDEVIVDSIGATLDSVAYSVNGETPVPLLTTPPLPQNGPADVTFEIELAPLLVGTHEICVIATGTDAGGTESVADCVDFEVVQDTADCSDPGVECMASADDGGVSTATVAGTNGFNKEMGVRSAPINPAECGGDECVASYDVLFDGEGLQGIAELTVVTSREHSTPPGLAAVFIDGEQITDRCRMEPIKSPVPCVKISKIQGGRTQYFVRFNADPGFHFR